MLIEKLLFTNKINKVLKKGLDFQSTRQLLISSNISNVDTPGYKAKEIDFSGQLRESMGMGGGQLKLKTTDSDHFFPGGAESIGRLEPEVIEEPDAAKSNGNNVNVDKEMSKLAENQLLYDTFVQLIQKRGSTVRSAVTEVTQT